MLEAIAAPAAVNQFCLNVRKLERDRSIQQHVEVLERDVLDVTKNDCVERGEGGCRRSPIADALEVGRKVEGGCHGKGL